jgi:hypothetical protein
MIVLEQLSLGMISDDEACLQLTGKLAPPGMKPLSGTMFKSATVLPTVAEPSNSGSTLNQNLKPTTPTTGRGQNKKAMMFVQPAAKVVTPDITVNIDNTQQSASVMRMKRNEDGDLIVERVTQ